jgi:hypothetical protein
MTNQSLIGNRLLGFMPDLGSVLPDTKLKALELTLVPPLGRHPAMLASQRPRSVNIRTTTEDEANRR